MLIVTGARIGPLELSWMFVNGAINVAYGIFLLRGYRAGDSLRRLSARARYRSGPGTRRRGAGPAVGYALLTGLSIATYTLWDKRAVGVLLIPPIAYEWGANVFRALILTPLALPRSPEVGG